jgi:hypothetical protein
METPAKISLLKDEYLMLQRFYEDFDARSLTIKGWSATIATAALGVGFYQSEFLWLFAAGASLAFWFLEALWKTFQYCYTARIRAIENAFRTDQFDSVVPLQTMHAWNESWRGIRVWRQFLNGIVFLPHLATFIIGTVLFVLEQLPDISLIQRH